MTELCLVDVFFSRYSYGTNCAPLLANLFHYSHKADFTQEYLKKNKKKLARSFNITFHCIDDVFLLNNSTFDDFVDRIYPFELEIKDTTDTARSASYLDLNRGINSEGRLKTKLFTTKEIISISRCFFPFIVATFHLYIDYIFLS